MNMKIVNDHVAAFMLTFDHKKSPIDISINWAFSIQ